MRCFSSGIGQIYTPCRHQSLKYCNGRISCKGSWLVLKVSFFFFFFSIFLFNMLLQLFTTSRIITVATTVVPFCFQGQFWGGFTSTKIFLSTASSEALIPMFSFMKHGIYTGRFSFKIAALNICKEFLEKWQSSYSA